MKNLFGLHVMSWRSKNKTAVGFVMFVGRSAASVLSALKVWDVLERRDFIVGKELGNKNRTSQFPLVWMWQLNRHVAEASAPRPAQTKVNEQTQRLLEL